MPSKVRFKIVQNVDFAISVMREAGAWLEKSGKTPSKWWQPKNMNRNFLLQHAEPSEFYVLLVDGKSAAAMILQDSQRNQSWKSIDKTKSAKALYIHWLCVSRKYAGKGLPKILVEFAEKQAKAKGIHLLRVDTNAKETKLRKIYESLGFALADVEQEARRQTAFYQKTR